MTGGPVHRLVDVFGFALDLAVVTSVCLIVAYVMPFIRRRWRKPLVACNPKA